MAIYTSAIKDLEAHLDQGEAEAIVLAQEMEATLVLMDERRGRRQLVELNIAKIGTIGVLLKAIVVTQLTGDSHFQSDCHLWEICQVRNP